MTAPFVILVVDDNPSNLFTLRALLKQLRECEIIEAGSGEQALARVVEHDVDLILLDVQMPGMDGFETARHLQMTERTRDIPIVFITAVFKAEEFVRRGYAIGAVDYLTKPIDDNQLLNRIRLYQRLHEHERSLAATIETLRRNEQALVTAKLAAESANHAKSIFLSNMSHELRTPLNAILGFAQIMERDPALGETHRRELGTIHRSGRHLLSLINDVLEISRIEAGRTIVQNEVFDLNAILSPVEEMTRFRAETKGIALSVERHGDLPSHVIGDANRLRQVLINLLGNAVKFTEQGSIFLRVTAMDGAIRFEVTDTGPGIAQEDQERIFHAFYQSEIGIAKGEGTGLGLTISREFVRLLGGVLTVRSEPGKGSVFAFTLPLPTAEAPQASIRRSRVVGLEPGQPEYRILIVEDEPMNSEVLGILLEKAGFQVRKAEDGRQAVEQFQSWQPHFIWMDMKMPVMDGYQATRSIRALPGGDAVKIAALTASVFEEDRAGILAAGCDEMATKPLEDDKLFALMGRLLGLRYRYAEVEKPATLTIAAADIRILIVDDDRDARFLTVELLKESGFMLREAASGLEALQVFEEWQPHLILMDMHMPRMDGMEATRRLRALPGGDQAIVVALTAGALDEQRAEFIAAGCDEMAIKPVDLNQVQELLARHPASRGADAAPA
jgi:two-component system sensor histidine kinase/response regulator